MRDMVISAAILAAVLSCGCAKWTYTSHVGPLVSDVRASESGLVVTECRFVHEVVITEFLDSRDRDVSARNAGCNEKTLALSGEPPCAPYVSLLRRAEPGERERLLPELPARCQNLFQEVMHRAGPPPREQPRKMPAPAPRPHRQYTREERAQCAQPLARWRAAATDKEAAARLREMPSVCREMVERTEDGQ